MLEGPDLFGQVAVTWPEIVDWCARVAGITPDSPRFLSYVHAWRVPEKVAQAKLAGCWPAVNPNCEGTLRASPDRPRW